MQDENVACHDIGKLSFERAVGCFRTPQLERATRFPMPQLERATCFTMPQLERSTRFPNVPGRVATRFRMFQFEHEWSPVRSLCIRLGFFYNNYYFLSQYAFHVYVLIVLIKAWFSQHVAFIR